MVGGASPLDGICINCVEVANEVSPSGYNFMCLELCAAPSKYMGPLRGKQEGAKQT